MHFDTFNDNDLLWQWLGLFVLSNNIRLTNLWQDAFDFGFFGKRFFHFLTRSSDQRFPLHNYHPYLDPHPCLYNHIRMLPLKKVDHLVWVFADELLSPVTSRVVPLYSIIVPVVLNWNKHLSFTIIFRMGLFPWSLPRNTSLFLSLLEKNLLSLDWKIG